MQSYLHTKNRALLQKYGPLIPILDIIGNKKRYERWRTDGLRCLPPAGGGWEGGIGQAGAPQSARLPRLPPSCLPPLGGGPRRRPHGWESCCTGAGSPLIAGVQRLCYHHRRVWVLPHLEKSKATCLLSAISPGGAQSRDVAPLDCRDGIRRPRTDVAASPMISRLRSMARRSVILLFQSC